MARKPQDKSKANKSPALQIATGVAHYKKAPEPKFRRQRQQESQVPGDEKKPPLRPRGRQILDPSGGCNF